MKKLRVKLSLSWLISLIAIATIFTTIATTYIPLYFVSINNTRDLAINLTKETSKKASNAINNFFEKQASTLSNIKIIFDKNIISIDNKEDRKKLFLNMLIDNKNISWISFGFPNGDFIGAQRTIDNSIRFIEEKYIPNNKNKPNRVFYYYEQDKDNNLRLKSTRRVVSNYNSIKRTWYKSAVEVKDKAVWTKVYVFNTSKKPGINLATVYDDEHSDKMKGVLTIALELEQLSKFLEPIQAGKNGDIFIINDKQDVISMKNTAKLIENIQGKYKLRKIEDINENSKVLYDGIMEEKLNINAIKEDKNFTYQKDGKKYLINLAKIELNNWILATIIPENDFLENVNRSNKKILINTPIIILAVIIFIILLSKRLIGLPLKRIHTSAQHLQKFEIDKIEVSNRESIVKELSTLSASMKMMKQGLNSFKKYLPTQIVKDVIQGNIEAKIGGKPKEVTVLFSDIENFTKTSEEMGSKLFEILEVYFHNLSGALTDHNANIDKYIGDAIMAFWNAPVDNKNHAIDACRAVLNAHKKLQILQNVWKREGKPLLKTRFGINTGLALVGNVGSEHKMDYTVLGDSVNLASRLEALNKVYGTNILISESTFLQAKEAVIVRRLDKVAVKGKTQPTNIYELIGLSDDIDILNKLQVDWIKVYETGLDYYVKGHFDEAIAYFKKVGAAKRLKDLPSELMIQRAEKMKSLNIKNFNGVYRALRK